MAYSTALAILLLGILIGRVELSPDNSQDLKKASGYEVESKPNAEESSSTNKDKLLDKRILGVVANLLGLGSLGGNISGAGSFGFNAGLGPKGITTDMKGQGAVQGGVGLGPGDAGAKFTAAGVFEGTGGLGPNITGLNINSAGSFEAHGGLAQSNFGLVANEPRVAARKLENDVADQNHNDGNRKNHEQSDATKE